MIRKQGIAVSPGVAFAQLIIVDNEEFDITEPTVSVAQVDDELERLGEALEVSRKEILELQKYTQDRIGKEAARIFDFHLGLLEDRVLIDKFTETITSTQVTAEYAVASVLRSYAKEFLDMPEYLAERVKDVYDIEKRLLRNLTGQERPTIGHLNRNAIIVTHDLTPSQTAGMDRRHIKGIATDAGGATSHTAIVARALGIPAVVGLEDITSCVKGNEHIIVDGNRGIVIIDPDTDTLLECQNLGAIQDAFLHSLDALALLPEIGRAHV